METNKDHSDKPDEFKPFVFSDGEVLVIRQFFNRQGELSPDLLEKMKNDPLMAEYRIFLFMPVIGDRIAKNNERPKVEAINNGTRDFVVKISFDDCAYIVKTLENSQEPAIAKDMAEIGVAPEQFESLNGLIIEKFIEGKAINKLDPATSTPDFMNMIGKKISDNIKKIHGKGILINDQLLSDDFSKSHTIITPEGDVYFIDFGASVDLTNFPDLSDEAVTLIIRSDTFASMTFYTYQGDKDKMKRFIDEYRQDVIGQFKNKEEAIADYDGRLIREGFHYLSDRISNVQSLVNGYKESISNKSN